MGCACRWLQQNRPCQAPLPNPSRSAALPMFQPPTPRLPEAVHVMPKLQPCRALAARRHVEPRHVWQHGAARAQPAVARVQHRPQHGFKQQSVAHPLADQHIHLLLWRGLCRHRHGLLLCRGLTPLRCAAWLQVPRRVVVPLLLLRGPLCLWRQRQLSKLFHLAGYDCNGSA